MQYTGVCRIAQLPNRGWLLGFGREVFFPRHKCSVEKTEYLMGVYLTWLYLFIYVIIVLYSYILIYLYCYCVVYLLCYLFITLLHACSMGVLLSLYLYSIFVPYFDLYFFITVVAVSLSFGFLRAKVWRFCQIPNTRRCLIRLKLFRKAFHKCCTFGYSKKLSTELFGVLTLGNHHFFMHVKRLHDDEMTE